jgi:hypothetical protein
VASVTKLDIMILEAIFVFDMATDLVNDVDVWSLERGNWMVVLLERLICW